jgi:predicted dehydrogenase
VTPGEGHRVAVVGFGRWGERLALDLLALGAGVTVIDPDSGAAARAVAVGCSVAPSLGSLDVCDVVVVATPTTTHADVAGRALELGVPVAVEKPLAADPGAAGALARAGGARLIALEKWRYHPAIEEMAGLVRRGAVGTVTGISTTRVGPTVTQADCDPVWTLLPHDLSIVRHVLGAVPEPLSARGEWRGRDLVGLVGLLGRRPWAAVEVSGRRARHRRSVEVVGEEGSLAFDLDEPTFVQHADAAGSVTTIDVSPEQPTSRQMAALLAHLDGAPAPWSTGAEGAESVAVIDGLHSMAMHEASP